MVRGGPVLGPLTLVLLLMVLAPVTGLGTVGWFVGLACGAVAFTSVAVGLVRYEHTVGPADVVTIVRLAMGCAVAALVAESFPVAGPDTALVTLATVALVLDAVDGKIARLTGTISAFGAKLDGEVDAFLMLVLSVYVGASTGWWVLSIGLVRYVFAAAGWVLPWMRGTLPPRFWRKVVTATEGIVLTVAAAGILPDVVAHVALVGGVALLAESFGRDVVWLWRHRHGAPEVPMLVADRAAG